MCQRNECRTKSEKYVCVRNKSITGSNSIISTNGSNGSSFGGSKQDIEKQEYFLFSILNLFDFTVF